MVRIYVEIALLIGLVLIGLATYWYMAKVRAQRDEEQMRITRDSERLLERVLREGKENIRQREIERDIRRLALEQEIEVDIRGLVQEQEQAIVSVA